MTRRAFLSASAAALAGTATFHAHAETAGFARNGAPLRVAVAGCGARGMLLLAGLRALAADGVPIQVAAVADENAARRQAARECGTGALACQSGVTAAGPTAGGGSRQPGAAVLHTPAALADWRDLAGRGDVDALVVALPDDLHAPAALTALQLGKHVYLETPVARSHGEAQSLAQAALRAGAVVAVGAAECALPAWRLAADLVRAGRIGRVHWCHSVAACGTRGGAADWRAQRERSQGLAAQLHYDQLMPVLQALHPGEALSATTAGGRWDSLGNTPDSLISTVRFGGGLSVNLVSSAMNTAGQRPVLRGELGSIEVCLHGVTLTPEQGPEEWMPAPQERFTAEQVLLRDWLDAVRGEHGPLCPLSLGLAAQQAVDLSVAACRDGGADLQA
jgi:predicted dehydrogenase